MGSQQVGIVSALHRYPVKSMLGESPTSASITAQGLDGDRAWALIDEETGKVVSVKRPKRWMGIFSLTATTTDDGAQVAFPDGRTLPIGDPELNGQLSQYLGRRVTLASVPPKGATFEEQWLSELKDGAGTYFDLPTRQEGDEGELVEGGQFMSEQGTFFNYGAIHLVTTSSTRRLEQLTPGTTFAPHRFRPNIVIETPDEGFVETVWQGRTMSIGDAQLALTFTVPRCVMTTLRQGDLPADREVLRAISRHNSIDVFSTGVSYPCVGLYADVVTQGEIRPGLPVRLHDDS